MAEREARDNARESASQARAGARESASEARAAAQESLREHRTAARDAAAEARAAARELRGAHPLRGREPGEPDTRRRIQQVAVELFTEQGYEATSLREIAERLGVTKAALYYHFKTKDDIIESLVADRTTRVEELIAWARTQPRTIETKREALRRYSNMIHEETHHDLMRFFERNQSSMTKHRAGVTMRELLLEFLDILTDTGASLTHQIRTSLAVFALHSAWFALRDPQTTDEQRQAAALEVALDLLEPRATEPRAAEPPDSATTTR